jgi:hypothetical protein
MPSSIRSTATRIQDPGFRIQDSVWLERVLNARDEWRILLRAEQRNLAKVRNTDEIAIAIQMYLLWVAEC